MTVFLALGFTILGLAQIVAGQQNTTTRIVCKSVHRFNETLQKCIVGVFDTCRSVESSPERYQCGLENTECRRAGTWGNGFCLCKPGFYLDRFDAYSCVLPTVRDYHDECDEYNKICKPEYNCREGTCDCPLSTQWNSSTSACEVDPCPLAGGRPFIYDEVLQKCILKIGARCHDWNYNPSGRYQCGVENTECRNSQDCRCKEGYYREPGNELSCVSPIMREYGETCDEFQNRCKDDYTCSTDGVCTCAEGGIWNSNDSLCYSDYHCLRRRGYNSFYDFDSGLCNCTLGLPGCVNGLNDTSVCPANAKIEIVSWRFGGDHTTHEEFQCSCEDGFFSTGQGRGRSRCVKRKSYGDSCIDQEVDPCSDISAFMCIGGTCSCNSSINTWDSREEECKLKVGEECYTYFRHFADGEYRQGDRCTRNSKCEYGVPTPRSRTCVCPPGFQQRVDGRCLGIYNSACSYTDDCLEGLHCVDGFCTCRDVLGQVYDETSTTCVNLVGSPCRNDSTPVCASFSYCNPATSTCTCNDGLTASANRGRCYRAIGFGVTCSALECDFSKGLACIDSKCACIDELSLSYDEKEQKCLAPVGSVCGAREVKNSCMTSTGNCEYYTIACTSGSHCNRSVPQEGKQFHIEPICTTNSSASPSAPTSN